jgi:NAD(P)-dependent dehydrogenase (short-subunit alcohol dehydrogenase family)
MGATETVDLFLELINDDRRDKAVELFAEHAVLGISTPGSDERTNLRGRDKVGGWFVRAGDGFRMYANDGRSMGASYIVDTALDLQLDMNLRSVFLFYRECLPMLRTAAAEHRNALVINVSSASGIHGEAWLGVYSATKRGLIGYTQAMNRELNPVGIKNTALCPAYVDTAMAGFVKEKIGVEKMITVDDVAGSVAYLLTLSPACLVPEIQFEQSLANLDGSVTA